MSNKSKKIIKYAVLVPLFSIFAITFALFSSFFIITKGEHLKAEKLTIAYTSNIQVYDCNNNQIKSTSIQETKVDTLNKHTIDAFISIEDKTFYTHNGINIKRMAGALIANIKNGKIVQGASTISQQLIKNTHLSNEKSIARKLKEIKLTLDLEKRYNKDQILQMYLSNIYFGNGYYGLENASQGYFNKKTQELNLSESAMLAGIISAPSSYNPNTNLDKAIYRRNIVLNEMLKDGKISQQSYKQAINETPTLYFTDANNLDQYNNAVLTEAAEVLHINQNQLHSRKLNIYTYKDSVLQEEVNKIIKNNTSNLDNTSSAAMITNNNGDIIAFTGNTKIDMYTCKRQPGSCIKPIIVYSPAIEQNLITPASIVVDEPIEYEGYSPENANKKYNGPVTVRECIEKSLNIPAVKVLNSTGIKKSKEIAQNMGITFSENDQNLSLALGGFTEGTTMKELTESYLTLQNNGVNFTPRLISKITDENGNILYERHNIKKQAIKPSTATLITDMLKGVAKSGTASRLSSLNIPVASKTGTVGQSKTNFNTDAWNVSYTSKHIITTWVGATNHSYPMPSNVNGATYPTNITKNILSLLYKNQKPLDFIPSEDTIRLNIDPQLKNKGILVLSDSTDSSSELFARENMPTIFNETPKKPELIINNFQNKKPELRFFTQSGFDYTIYKNELPIKTFSGDGNEAIFIDDDAIPNNIYLYKVVVNANNISLSSNETKVLCLK